MHRTYILRGPPSPEPEQFQSDNLHSTSPAPATLDGMQEYELDYDVQEVRLSDHVFKVTTVANEALPLEMLMQLQERSEEISGQRLWEGSLLLCAYLAEHCCSNNKNDDNKTDNGARKSKLDLTGKSVLELGAGTGVVSMLAHRLGASPVVMTDGDEKCVVMAQKNIEENDIGEDQAFVAVLRWGDAESTSSYCDGFSEWEARCPEWAGRSENSGPASAKTDVEVAARALAQSTALPAASARTREVVGVGHTPTGAAHPAAPEEIAGSPQTSIRSPLKSFDFVLAGDVLYKRCLIDPFLGTVRDMLAPGGRMLLCHVPRAGVTYEIVERAFVEAGFTFEILNGDEKESNCESRREGVPEGGAGSSMTAVEAAQGSRCDTTAVGGVELCVDDARRARLYEVHLADARG